MIMMGIMIVAHLVRIAVEMKKNTTKIMKKIMLMNTKDIVITIHTLYTKI